MDAADIETLSTTDLDVYLHAIICGNYLIHSDPNAPFDKWLCVREPHQEHELHQAVDGTNW